MDKKMEYLLNPSIMESMESSTLVKAEISEAMKPDVIQDTDLKSIPFIHSSDESYINHDTENRSFLLMDGSENLQIPSPEIFCKKLQCSENEKVKVISVFGNTGDGKSHTMNHTFFGGEEVFRTSPEQNSCTVGVCAAMQQNLKVICLDTEGLLGISSNGHKRNRMLLKILAISDIVIYRTRTERLHSDMFEFLGTASKAFSEYFDNALQSLVIGGSTKTLGPALIIFHETRHTKPLSNSIQECAEDKLRERFTQMNLGINAFTSIRYVGVQSSGRPTDYSPLFSVIELEIENTAVRSPRQPGVIYRAMKALNKKFSGDIPQSAINPFPEQYFTCTVTCDSCNKRCQRSMGHITDGEDHNNSDPCTYQHQYENKVYLCKLCQIHGKEIVVTIRSQCNKDSSWYGLAKYAWKGSVIECQNCGEIYRSRQYWYGNKEPEDIAVRSKIVHVWNGGLTAKGPINSGQMVIDGVSLISDAISSIGSHPTKMLSGWVADKVAPTYWKPNSEIFNCHACKKNFNKTGLPKHHCRSCGEGFCNACSLHKLPVLERGWDIPVRVCNECKEELMKKKSPESNDNRSTTKNAGPLLDDSDITVRRYGETLYNTISSVASVLEYPKDLIKDSARPSYWVPDVEAPSCFLCESLFGTAEELERSSQVGNSSKVGDCRRHHCRACGLAVCHTCSTTRRVVPERGWLTDVRICDECANVKK